MSFKKDDIVEFCNVEKYPNFSPDNKAIIYEEIENKYALLSSDGHEIRDVLKDDIKYVAHLEGISDAASAMADKKMQQRTSLPYIVERFRNHKPLEITSWLALFSGVGIKSQYFGAEGKSTNFAALQNEILAMYEPFKYLLLCDKEKMDDALKKSLKNSKDFITAFDDLYEIINKNFSYSDNDREKFYSEEKLSSNKQNNTIEKNK